jgi:hypothetical protein
MFRAVFVGGEHHFLIETPSKSVDCSALLKAKPFFNNSKRSFWDKQQLCTYTVIIAEHIESREHNIVLKIVLVYIQIAESYYIYIGDHFLSPRHSIQIPECGLYFVKDLVFDGFIISCSRLAAVPCGVIVRRRF